MSIISLYLDLGYSVPVTVRDRQALASGHGGEEGFYYYISLSINMYSARRPPSGGEGHGGLASSATDWKLVGFYFCLL